jgi:hypothetical protein
MWDHDLHGAPKWVCWWQQKGAPETLFCLLCLSNIPALGHVAPGATHSSSWALE